MFLIKIPLRILPHVEIKITPEIVVNFKIYVEKNLTVKFH